MSGNGSRFIGDPVAGLGSGVPVRAFRGVGLLAIAIAGVLGLQDLRRHFRSVLSVQDVGRGKPAPDLFLKTAELTGMTPAECVVIEDSAPGVAAARAAGMRGDRDHQHDGPERLADADAVVTDYAEVRRLLLG